MTRYKSRVARRSRRRARRGTRKQSGGMFEALFSFFRKNPDAAPAVDATAAATAPVPGPAASPAVPEGNKGFLGFLNKNTDAAAVAKPVAVQPPLPPGQGGGRKTRHRRRSPRRHRK
jgi:hypothetical protein